MGAWRYQAWETGQRDQPALRGLSLEMLCVTRVPLAAAAEHAQ